jgi:hypothetical protein
MIAENIVEEMIDNLQHNVAAKSAPPLSEGVGQPKRPKCYYDYGEFQSYGFYRKSEADLIYAALEAENASLVKNRDQWERNSAAENLRAGNLEVENCRLKAKLYKLERTSG